MAEPNLELRERFRGRFGEKVIVADRDELLERHRELDAVFIFADNRTSTKLGAQAASLQLHVMAEKPMAANLALADRLAAAAHRVGVLRPGLKAPKALQAEAERFRVADSYRRGSAIDPAD